MWFQSISRFFLSVHADKWEHQTWGMGKGWRMKNEKGESCRKYQVLLLLLPLLLFCCHTVTLFFFSNAFCACVWVCVCGEVMTHRKEMWRRQEAAYSKLLMPLKYPTFTLIKTHPSSQLIQSITENDATLYSLAWFHRIFNYTKFRLCAHHLHELCIDCWVYSYTDGIGQSFSRSLYSTCVFLQLPGLKLCLRNKPAHK